MSQASTHIQWTMKLSDAALISAALQEVAISAESQANYLESEAYAQKQPGGLSDADKQRVKEYRIRAVRLRELIES